MTSRQDLDQNRCLHCLVTNGFRQHYSSSVWGNVRVVKRFNRLCRASEIVSSCRQRTALRCGRWRHTTSVRHNLCWVGWMLRRRHILEVLTYSHPTTKTFSPMCCCWGTWMRPDCRVHVSQCLHVRGVYIETKRPTFYFFAWRFATLPLDVHGRLFLSWSLFLQCAHIHSSYRYTLAAVAAATERYILQLLIAGVRCFFHAHLGVAIIKFPL